MKKSLSLCILTCIQIVALCQTERVLRFSADPIDNDEKAIVRWTMAEGSTCSDVVVERSSDNINFQEAYIYPSICGNEASAQSYSWIDAKPLQTSNSFYRLKLDGVEFSLTSEVNLRRSLDEDEISMTPNPNEGVFSLEFANPDKKRFDILLFSLNGTLIFETRNLTGNSYFGRFSNLKSGIYILKVAMESNQSRSIKLVIR